MDTGINHTPPPSDAGTRTSLDHRPIRQTSHRLSVIAVDAASLYCTGGILGILLGFSASIVLSQLRRLGR
ncbi:hypothetical protein [uncultured Paludibaculum sp.]|uniref:hypothetical protein n=1 Tax=uncultured Paludibaculum sp. TaxID=1765020 RepID=UPI002AAC44C3|nr:hypothetical protein [uncultured Paludibaculum sp.]